MAVDDAVAVRIKKTAERRQVTGQVVVLPDGQLGDLAAQGLDFIIIKTGLVIMVQKVELDFVTVDGAVDVHHKGFHPAGIHGRHHLQNANRRHLYPSLF